MFDIDMQFDDVDICSIENEDVIFVQNWFNSEQGFCDKNASIDLHEFHKRFLEYYASECEFFLKINKNNKFIGIIKGRIEFKNPNEVWFSCYLLDNKERGKGLGTKIINYVVKGFNESYGISSFSVAVELENPAMLRFWKNNSFEIQRMCKNLYGVQNEFKELLLLRREEKN